MPRPRAASLRPAAPSAFGRRGRVPPGGGEHPVRLLGRTESQGRRDRLPGDASGEQRLHGGPDGDHRLAPGAVEFGEGAQQVRGRRGAREAALRRMPRLVATYDHGLSVPEFSLGYHWDIVPDGPKATWICLPGDEAARAADPLLARLDGTRRDTLIAVPEDHGTYRFDIRLQGEGETAFLEFR